MKHTLIEMAKSCGRPAKRALEAVIDNRLADYHMPPEMPGDLLLTFDDGPHPEYTPRLLDLLDEYGARALFFVIGSRADQYPDLVRACYDRGHALANHTYSHLNDGLGGRYTRSRVREDISRCRDVVHRATGLVSNWFRPPRGELNSRTWGAAQDTGHRVMLWSVEGGEWGRRQDWPPTEISAYLRNTVRKRDILLLHDDNEKTLVVTADLLKRLKSEDFDLVSAAASLR